MTTMWKILKGKGKNQILDSTHTDRRKALARLKQLRDSLRGTKCGNYASEVSMVEATEEDPINYQRPRAGPWTNYEPQPGASVIRHKGKNKEKLDD